MQTHLRGKDFIETNDWTTEELDTLLASAFDLKLRFATGEPHRFLPDKTVFLIFFDKSTRTRNAFEAGITQLGGHAHDLSPNVMQISHGESPKDTGIILSRFGHGIAIRHDLVPGEGNSYMREVAQWADRPVINLQCDVDHPTQTLADLMTLREKFGPNLRGLKVAVSWAYAPSYAKPLSVPQGLISLLPRFGIDVTLAYPKGWDLMPEVMEKAKKQAKASGAKLEVTHSMDEAFKGADVVYPKSWGATLTTTDMQESADIAKKYVDWIADERRMALTNDGIYLHCLPADRNIEVTDAVIDGPQSRVYDEAENRLHVQKAVMALTMR